MLNKSKSLIHKDNNQKLEDADKVYDDDIFIVSYPKSGNTWMRFLLANLMTQKEINFHSAADYIPDFEAHKELLEKCPRPRILKSHSLFDMRFKKIIYLIRDPRDVYVSYFHYLKKKLPNNQQDFSVFLRKKDLYPSRWHVHIESWLMAEKNDFLVIRYEDMLLDTYAELRKVVQFLAWEISDVKLSEAIKKSSFKEMFRLENEKGRPFRSEEDKSGSSKFVRSGKSGEWKSYFSKEDLEFLRSECGNLLEKMGYPI